MISLFVKLSIQEGKVDEAIELIKGMMDHVKTEEGTVLYTLNRTKDDPNTLIFMERYTDEAALGAHSGSDEFKAFNKKMGGCVAGRPEITMMEEIASI